MCVSHTLNRVGQRDRLEYGAETHCKVLKGEVTVGQEEWDF